MLRFVITLLLFSALILSACTSTPEPKASEQETQATAATPPATIQGAGTIPEVNYTTPSIDRSDKDKPAGSPFVPQLMQEVFPLDAGGLNRFSSANGFPKILDNQIGSETRMTYKNPTTEQQITISIKDSGTLGLTMDQIADWIKNPRNTVTENTIDRTGSLKGFPYYEFYVKEVEEGELHLLVNKRFEVVARGRGVSYETLRQVMEKLDLGSLH